MYLLETFEHSAGTISSTNQINSVNKVLTYL